MTDEFANEKPPSISLARRMIGFPVMGIGAGIVFSPFIGIWNLHNAVALFGGGLVFFVGSICALGWEVVRKWRGSRDGM